MPTAVNMSVLAPAIQQIVAGGIRDQFEQGAETYNMFGKGDAPYVNGKGYRIPSSLRPPTGVTGISEGGSFPQPGAETLDDMYAYPKNMVISFEFTGDALRDAKDSSSMVRGLTDLLEKRNLALKKEANRQAFNDGSGLRAIYKSGTTTCLMYNCIDHTPLASFGSTKGARHLQVGESYDWYDATLTTKRATITVSSKNNKSITIASAVAGALDGDILVLKNSRYKMPNGLAHIVNNDSGIFQLQDRSKYPELKCPVTDLNGQSISVADVSKLKRLLISRAGVGKAKTAMMLISLAQDDALTRLGQNYKQWAGDDKVFDGSFDSFKHGDTVTQLDPDDCEDRIYFVVKSELKRYEKKPLGLYDEDGLQLRQRSGSEGYGSDSWTGSLGSTYNYGTDEPRCMALIKRCSVAGLASQVADND